MKVLLLGVGMQGKAALYDLLHHSEGITVIAADKEIEALRAHVKGKQWDGRVRCEPVDAADPEHLHRLMALGPDVAISLLPPRLHTGVAVAAVDHGIHLVTASYAAPDLKNLAERAGARRVAILPEFGMDPGIDLVFLGEAVRRLDRVEEIASYGAGFPESAAADNPLKYRVTWNFEGVLKSYWRSARLIRNGKILDVPETDIFSPEHIHEVEIHGLGTLEAFPNGDAMRYIDLPGIEKSNLRNMGRFVLRWPGHSAFWKKLVDLHLLDDEPVEMDGALVDRKRFLAAALSPHIQYGPHERDVVVVRVAVKGMKGGKKQTFVLQVIDRGDPETGLKAMHRTVGFTASIGAQMIGTGIIKKRGILSPAIDVPYRPFAEALKRRGLPPTKW